MKCNLKSVISIISQSIRAIQFPIQAICGTIIEIYNAMKVKRSDVGIFWLKDLNQTGFVAEYSELNYVIHPIQ